MDASGTPYIAGFTFGDLGEPICRLDRFGVGRLELIDL